MLSVSPSLPPISTLWRKRGFCHNGASEGASEEEEEEEEEEDEDKTESFLSGAIVEE